MIHCFAAIAATILWNSDSRALTILAGAAVNTLPAEFGSGLNGEIYLASAASVSEALEYVSHHEPDDTFAGGVLFADPGGVGFGYPTDTLGHLFDYWGTMAPEIASLPASNFILRYWGYLAVHPGDHNPETPEIDVLTQLFTSDLGYFEIADAIIASLEQPGASTYMPIGFEAPGMYPIELIFAFDDQGETGFNVRIVESGMCCIGEGLFSVPPALLYRQPVPDPSTGALVLLGLAALSSRKRAASP
jgi:hypothetical protein